VMPLMSEVDGHPLARGVRVPTGSPMEKENDLPGAAAWAGSRTGLIQTHNNPPK